MTGDKSSLVFLEYPGEVDAFLKGPAHVEKLSSPPAVVALTPHVQAYVKHRGLDFESTLPYLSEASRSRAWQKSAELNCWVKEHFNFEDNWGVRLGYSENLAWYLRWLVNYLLWSLEILNNAVAERNPQSLTVFNPELQDTTGPLVAETEPYFGTMAQRFAEDRDLEAHSVCRRMHHSPGTTARAITHRLVTTIAPNPVVSRLHRDQLSTLASRETVLFTSKSYRLDVLAGRVQREKGLLPVLLSDWASKKSLSWPLSTKVIPPFAAEARLGLLTPLAREDQDSRRRLEDALHDFISDLTQATELFSHLGVPFADLVAQKVRLGIRPALLNLHLRAAAHQLLLETLRPSLVISNGCRVDDITLGELCRVDNIPSLMITHGSHVPPSDDAERYEWGEHGRRLINAPYQCTALQSPLAEEFRQVFPSDSRGIRTGPLIWVKSEDRERSEDLRRRMLGESKQDRVIVHAGTPKSRQNMRFHVYESSDEYIQSIQDLVEAVEKVPGTRLIVMFRPSPEISLNDLKTLVSFSGKAILSADAPLIDVLGFTDLLVSFSSTVVEEALLNHVPVLLYGAHGRYQHIKVSNDCFDSGNDLGAGPVYHVRKSSDLPDALQTILDGRENQASLDDDFDPYVYRPEQVTPLSTLLEDLRESAHAQVL